MDISNQDAQPVSVDTAPQDSDLHPLCGVGSTMGQPGYPMSIGTDIGLKLIQR
jgi:hypothetical protein